MSRHLFAILLFYAGTTFGAVASAQPVSLATLESEHARVRQGLAVVAEGLDTQFQADPVAAAERLHALARQAALLLETTGELPPGTGRSALMQEVVATLRRIVQLQEHVRARAIVMVERLQPGEPQQRLQGRRGVDRYQPLFRSDAPELHGPQLSNAERVARQTGEFVESGGRIEQFQRLDRKFLESVPSDTLFTWVQIDGAPIVYPGDVKHVVLAKGQTVRGAGNGRVIRSRGGEILLVLWSVSSGNYKPGLGALEAPLGHTVALGVPESRIMTTTTPPLDAGIIGLLARMTRGVDRLGLKSFLAELQRRTTPRLYSGKAWMTVPTARPPASWRSALPRSRPTPTTAPRATPTPRARGGRTR